MWGKFSRSMGWAFQGIICTLKSERHMRFHLLATIIALFTGVWLNISAWQWLFIILAIVLVWITELINTAIEAVVDLYTSRRHPLAKIAKDVAAGAVLVASLYSLVVALVIFLPKLLKLFK